VLLAFASGTLISALAFELFPEAVHLGGLWPAGLGLIAGGLTFVVINTALDSWVAKSAGDPHEVPALSSEAAENISGAEAQQTERVQEAATQQAARAAVGFALLAAVTLDGVPENLALGVSLLSGGGSLALLVAIFCSNFPESLVGAVAMRRGGRSAPFAIGIWTLTAVLLTAAVVFGRGVFAQFPEEHLAFPLAFAGRLRRGRGFGFAGRHADARGLRARPSAQLDGYGGRVLGVVRPQRLSAERLGRSSDPPREGLLLRWLGEPYFLLPKNDSDGYFL
jgi:zinc transporter, ZIP family